MKEYEVEIKFKPFKVKVKASNEDDAIETATDVFFRGEYNDDIEFDEIEVS